MRISKLGLVLVLGMMLAAAQGCRFSFTTANISSLKLSKDETGATEAGAFSRGDAIYAIAAVSNVPDKVTLKWRLYTEKVSGQPENEPVPQFDTSLELTGSGDSTYTLTPGPTGWPAGRYRIEVSMLAENGEQKDQKATTFNVGGEGAD
ncbi:MAG TPA: hypothetical protein VF723_11685 [Pyrinomonadaceae bacterium]